MRKKTILTGLGTAFVGVMAMASPAAGATASPVPSPAGIIVCPVGSSVEIYSHVVGGSVPFTVTHSWAYDPSGRGASSDYYSGIISPTTRHYTVIPFDEERVVWFVNGTNGAVFDELRTGARCV